MIRTLAAGLLASLLTGAALAQTTAPATGAPSKSTMPMSAPSTTAPITTKPATGATAAPMAANQYTTEAAAKAACSTDTVVWANLSGSKAYHMSGAKYYGKTKKGAYMCQKDADAGGFHAAGKRAAKAAAATKS